MSINKHIERSILFPIFLFEVNLDISNFKKQLINKINEGIKKSNLNYVTNVKGNMTHWKYFNNDKLFHKVLTMGLSEIKKSFKFTDCFLVDSWGIKINQNDYTELHNHYTAFYSGILYLNNCEQTLDFPELNITIQPKEGSFLFFSSILNHKSDKNKSLIPKYAIPFNFNEIKNWE